MIGASATTTFEDLTTARDNTIIPGTTYRYSVAGVNKLGEGCNGPIKSPLPTGCSDVNCPECAIDWKSGTMPSKPTDLYYLDRVVTTNQGTIKVSNSITTGNVNVNSTGTVNLTAGNRLDVIGNIISNGPINLKIDPSVR